MLDDGPITVGRRGGRETDALGLRRNDDLAGGRCPDPWQEALVPGRARCAVPHTLETFSGSMKKGLDINGSPSEDGGDMGQATTASLFYATRKTQQNKILRRDAQFDLISSNLTLLRLNAPCSEMLRVPKTATWRRPLVLILGRTSSRQGAHVGDALDRPGR